MMQTAGDTRVALRFFKAALAYFIITLALGLVMITGNPYSLFGLQGAKAAHVHAGLIGFVTLIIMGAMYQIVPTLTGSKLFGGGLVRIQLIVINAGILGLFITLLFTDESLRRWLTILFGIITIIGSIIFAYIIFRTAAASRSKIKPITLAYFKTAVIFYLTGITMGILMVGFPGFFSKFLLSKTAHAHLGTLGFITMTIFGAEYQMVPMLSLQKLWSERWAKINLWLYSLAVVVYWFGLMRLDSAMLTFSVGLLLLSVYMFLFNMLQTLKKAKWGGLDVSVKFMVAGLVFLLIATTIGAAMAVFYHFGLIEWLKSAGLASESLSIYGLIWAHAHLALIGFVTLTIMGAMYHLVPMLVWMEKYGPKMGVEAVPKIQDLFSSRTAGLILIAASAGVFGILFGSLYSAALLIKSSAFLLAAAGTLFSYVMYKLMI